MCGTVTVEFDRILLLTVLKFANKEASLFVVGSWNSTEHLNSLFFAPPILHHVHPTNHFLDRLTYSPNFVLPPPKSIDSDWFKT